MEIEDGKVKEFFPYYYRNDYAGIEQFAQDEETGSINAHTVQTQTELLSYGADTSQNRAFCVDTAA